MKQARFSMLGVMPLLAALVILVGGGYGLFLLPADQLTFGWWSKAFLGCLFPFGLLFLWMGLGILKR